jgi:hypothetical protein
MHGVVSPLWWRLRPLQHRLRPRQLVCVQRVRLETVDVRIPLQPQPRLGRWPRPPGGAPRTPR